VLVAEDNAINRKVVTKLMEKQGFTAIVTENGREALDVLLREQVDVVLMDIQMPIMDGFEAIRAIRTMERISGEHLPIVALTAHAMKGDRERCLAAGADDYVSKPIRIADLLAAIHRARMGAPSLNPVAPPHLAVPAPGTFDMAGALERIEGDRDLLDEIARLFADECPTNLQEIRQAMAAGNVRLLERLAHTMKGAALNLGGAGVAEAAGTLEQQARAGDLANAGTSVRTLEKEIGLLLPELESFCRKVAH
jgi:two-component system, sensor histidine kinase and response regulator